LSPGDARPVEWWRRCPPSRQHRAVDPPVIGRDSVLDEAWRALGADGAVLAEGPAGIGKTAGGCSTRSATRTGSP
jgi:hypothetical protein